MMRTLHAALICLALSGCKSCSERTQTVAPADAGAGVVPIQAAKAPKDGETTQAKPPEAKLVNEAHQALALVAKGYAAVPAKARPLRPEDARARKGLGQAMSGFRFALTGENKLLLLPQSPQSLPPHTIVRSQVLGLNVATITLRVPNPGGTAAMATGKVMLGKLKPTAAHVQRARLNALERMARQSRGSGQILPISSSEPRVVDGVLLLEVNARVFRDGSP
jgi:hypothetical protein